MRASHTVAGGTTRAFRDKFTLVMNKEFANSPIIALAAELSSAVEMLLASTSARRSEGVSLQPGLTGTGRCRGQEHYWYTCHPIDQPPPHTDASFGLAAAPPGRHGLASW